MNTKNSKTLITSGPKIRGAYNLLNGKTVDLVPDNISKDRDVYGRLLRYVFLGNIDINKQMITDGFAFAYLKYSFAKEEEYTQAQVTAKQNSSGIWGNDKKETIIEEQKKKSNNFWQSLSVKAYLISGVLILLVIIGIYYYYKK